MSAELLEAARLRERCARGVAAAPAGHQDDIVGGLAEVDGDRAVSREHDLRLPSLLADEVLQHPHEAAEQLRVQAVLDLVEQEDAGADGELVHRRDRDDPEEPVADLAGVEACGLAVPALGDLEVGPAVAAADGVQLHQSRVMLLDALLNALEGCPVAVLQASKEWRQALTVHADLVALAACRCSQLQRIQEEVTANPSSPTRDLEQLGKAVSVLLVDCTQPGAGECLRDGF